MVSRINFVYLYILVIRFISIYKQNNFIYYTTRSIYYYLAQTKDSLPKFYSTHFDTVYRAIFSLCIFYAKKVIGKFRVILRTIPETISHDMSLKAIKSFYYVFIARNCTLNIVLEYFIPMIQCEISEESIMIFIQTSMILKI